MDVFEKIKKSLNDSGVEYEVIEHGPVYTSEDAARIRDTSLDMGAKALVLMADKKPVLAVLPGNQRMDFKRFKKEFGVKDLRMAKPEEVKDLTSLEIGSIPPFGSVMNLKSYFDKSFLNKETIAFNAGLHTVSIKMNAKDLIKVENPTITSIV